MCCKSSPHSNQRGKKILEKLGIIYKQMEDDNGQGCWCFRASICGTAAPVGDQGCRFKMIIAGNNFLWSQKAGLEVLDARATSLPTRPAKIQRDLVPSGQMLLHSFGCFSFISRPWPTVHPADLPLFGQIGQTEFDAERNLACSWHVQVSSST